MGTKVQHESYFQGYSLMRDFNEDVNNCSWPLHCGDKTFTNGHYYNGFLPSSVAEAYPGYDKDSVKQKMLEHEAIFKKQLYELHRLYRIQRNLMDEAKSKELNKGHMPIETSLSTSLLASRAMSEDARRWHPPNFPLTDTVSGRPSTSSIEDNQSPLGSMMGTSAEVSPLPTKNCSMSRDVETLESRPQKVRRKMFDLQLPADEYVDTEEEEVETRDENMSTSTNFFLNRDKKFESETGTKIFLGNGGKNNGQGVTSQSEQQLRTKPNVADLNEPIEVEEDNNPSFAHVLGDVPFGESHRNKQVSKPNSQLLSFPKEDSVNSLHLTDNGTSVNLHLQNNAIGKRWAPYMFNEEHIKDMARPSSHGFKPEKLPINSQPAAVLFNKTQEPSVFFHSTVGHLREPTSCSLEHAERNHKHFNNKHQDSVIASHMPNSYPIAVSNLGKSWCQSISSWEKPSGGFLQSSMSDKVTPYPNSSSTTSRSSQSSYQNNGIYGDRWNNNSIPMSKTSFVSETPNRNGIHYGSSLGPKDPLIFPPPGNFGYLPGRRPENGVSLQFDSYSSGKFERHSNYMDLNSAEDVKPQATHLNCSSKKVHLQHDCEIIDLETQNEDHVPSLPWLRNKPTCKSESNSPGKDLNIEEFSSRKSLIIQSSNGSETGRPCRQVADHYTKPDLNSKVDDYQNENGDSSRCKKILGFSLFQQSLPKKESCSFKSNSVSLPKPSEGEAEKQRTCRELDINLPFDEATLDSSVQAAAEVEHGKRENDKRNINQIIDLNTCMSEEEAPLMPTAPGSNQKVVLEIDLEAPAVPEMEDEVVPEEGFLDNLNETHLQKPQPELETAHDELMKMAAETIVVFSTCSQQPHLDDVNSAPPETSMTDPLLWFVDVVSAYGEDLESKFTSVLVTNDAKNKGSLSANEIDYYECMTLNLTETKEEDYMPKPLVPENLKLEESGTNLLTNRTRKGPGRRGRQRRDFQRDILPGLVSLSRHEVTEDIQTFGGLMRATGHLWPSGLTGRNSTRNGCRRGRRRKAISPPPVNPPAQPPPPPPPPPPTHTTLIQQLNTVEARLEDRSLAGWGKTTRRPRRQRCPAGNLSSVPLT